MQMACYESVSNVVKSKTRCDMGICNFHDAGSVCCFTDEDDECDVNHSAKVVPLEVKGHNGTTLNTTHARCANAAIGVIYISVSDSDRKGHNSTNVTCSQNVLFSEIKNPSQTRRWNRSSLNISRFDTNHKRLYRMPYINEKGPESPYEKSIGDDATTQSTGQSSTMPTTPLLALGIIFCFIISFLIAIEWRRKILKRRKGSADGLNDETLNQQMHGPVTTSEGNPNSEYSTIDEVDNMNVTRHVDLNVPWHVVHGNSCSVPGRGNRYQEPSTSQQTESVGICDKSNGYFVLRCSPNQQSVENSEVKPVYTEVDGDGYLVAKEIKSCTSQKDRKTNSDIMNGPYQSIDDVVDFYVCPTSDITEKQTSNVPCRIAEIDDKVGEISKPEESEYFRLESVDLKDSNVKSDYFVLEKTKLEVLNNTIYSDDESVYHSIDDIVSKNKLGSPNVQGDSRYKLDNFKPAVMNAKSENNETIYFDLEKNNELDNSQYDHLLRNNEHVHLDASSLVPCSKTDTFCPNKIFAELEKSTQDVEEPNDSNGNKRMSATHMSKTDSDYFLLESTNYESNNKPIYKEEEAEYLVSRNATPASPNMARNVDLMLLDLL